MIAKDINNPRNWLVPLVNKAIFRLIIQNASFKTFFSSLVSFKQHHPSFSHLVKLVILHRSESGGDLWVWSTSSPWELLHIASLAWNSHNDPPEQLSPDCPATLLPLRQSEVTEWTAQGCDPPVGVTENPWPFLCTTPIYFPDWQMRTHFQANRFSPRVLSSVLKRAGKGLCNSTSGLHWPQPLSALILTSYTHADGLTAALSS